MEKQVYEVFESLSKNTIVMQLRMNGEPVNGFCYEIATAQIKQRKRLRSMLDREKNARNMEERRIDRHNEVR